MFFDFPQRYLVTPLMLLYVLLSRGAKIRVNSRKSILDDCCKPLIDMSDIAGEKCICGGSFKEYEIYPRTLKFSFIVAGTRDFVTITVDTLVLRTQCKDCKKTDARLPDFVIPYVNHVLPTLNVVLISALCKQYAEAGRPISDKAFASANLPEITESELNALYINAGATVDAQTGLPIIERNPLTPAKELDALSMLSREYSRLAATVLDYENNNRKAAKNSTLQPSPSPSAPLKTEQSILKADEFNKPSFYATWNGTKEEKKPANMDAYRKQELWELKNAVKQRFIRNKNGPKFSKVCHVLETMCNKFSALAPLLLKNYSKIPFFDEGNPYIIWNLRILRVQ
ncbi:MAG: hypothetical protein LBT59_11575 [Clostridiales bacterium]|jgi:hypothetical protein|nr:hypothetical protein [Clostridiales bacterium]